MKLDDVIEKLGRDSQVAEFYVLVRELKLYLAVGHDQYNPCIRVKIYKTFLHGSEVYTFGVSHYVHTPVQITPYYPSCTTENNESSAIDSAISSTTCFIRSAIDAGHEPSEKWLIRNEEF